MAAFLPTLFPLYNSRCSAIFLPAELKYRASQAAQALVPGRRIAAALLLLAFLNASLFGAADCSVTTAYVMTEAFGMESGLNFKYKEAPQFYGIFLVLLLLGGAVVLLPFLPLITI